MAKVWKIVAVVDGDHPVKEYFLVAVEDQSTALAMLRSRKGLSNADLTLVGEASPEFLDRVGGVKDGQIFSVMAMT
jgi:hypothetical protein